MQEQNKSALANPLKAFEALREFFAESPHGDVEESEIRAFLEWVDKSRAAVAELLAADRALDAAVKAEGEARRERGNWNVNPLPHGHPAVVALRAAYERHHAALAAFGGA